MTKADLQTIDRFLALGDMERAVELAERAILDGSTSLVLRLRLVSVYLKQRKYREASRLVVESARLKPGNSGEWIELAKRLIYFNESHALLGLVERVLAEKLPPAGWQADLAAMLSMTGEQEVALKLQERVIGAAQVFPAWHYNRSQMHMYLGRFAEAERDLRICLAREPGMARAYWALSKLPGVPLSETELDRMKRLLSKCGDSEEEVFLQYALFNFLDRFDRIDEAWQALARGCQVKRKLLNYDEGKTQAYFQLLMKNFGRSQYAPSSPEREERRLTPIFIVGMHRSGTTLLESLLCRHSAIAGGGELYDFPAQLRHAIGRHFSGPSDIAVLENLPSIDFSSVGARYLERVAWRAGGRSLLIDKLPSNFINIGYIRRALPHAKVIHIGRNPMDTCFSNLKELFSNACAYSYDQGELTHYYRWHKQLIEHWQTLFPGFVLDISFEKLTENPEREVRRVLEFCGLGFQADCLDTGGNSKAVNSASSVQVREPIHRRGVDAWRRYSPYLDKLRAEFNE